MSFKRRMVADEVGDLEPRAISARKVAKGEGRFYRPPRGDEASKTGTNGTNGANGSNGQLKTNSGKVLTIGASVPADGGEACNNPFGRAKRAPKRALRRAAPQRVQAVSSAPAIKKFTTKASAQKDQMKMKITIHRDHDVEEEEDSYDDTPVIRIRAAPKRIKVATKVTKKLVVGKKTVLGGKKVVIGTKTVVFGRKKLGSVSIDNDNEDTNGNHTRRVKARRGSSDDEEDKEEQNRLLEELDREEARRDQEDKQELEDLEDTWVRHQEQLNGDFIRSRCGPPVYWAPASHTSRTRELLRRSRREGEDRVQAGMHAEGRMGRSDDAESAGQSDRDIAVGDRNGNDSDRASDGSRSDGDDDRSERSGSEA